MKSVFEFRHGDKLQVWDKKRESWVPCTFVGYRFAVRTNTGTFVTERQMIRNISSPAIDKSK